MSALPSTCGAGSSVEVVRRFERAATLFHPLRLRIMEGLQAQPDSATGLAKRLGLARQKVNYHLRELEKERLVQPVEERRKGNCVERVVRSSAAHYLISPEALGALATDPATVQDRFSWTYLVAVAAQAIRDLATLRSRADKAGKRLATFTLQTDVRFASPAALNEFTTELSNEVARLIAKHHDETAKDGRLFRFFIGAHPAVTKAEEDAPPAPDDASPSSQERAS